MIRALNPRTSVASLGAPASLPACPKAGGRNSPARMTALPGGGSWAGGFSLSPGFRRLQFFLLSWRHLSSAILPLLVLHGNHSRAEDLTVEVVELPSLRIYGQSAKAHTQGLEVTGGKYYVTARRDDVTPKRALLLRAEPAKTDWDVWDITPVGSAGAETALDHPGGMQSDGKRLWIPLAESKRKGRSIIRVFPLAGMVGGQPLKSEFEFPVNDHIGAVAVAANRGLVFGANWDTEAVYVWDLEGHLKRTLNGSALGIRGLGVVAGSDSRAGVAVQDWKVIGDRLFASGLFRAPGSAPVSPKSRLMSFANFMEPDFQRWVVAMPLHEGTELTQEAMAISDGVVHFLPEDLGASNRLFRVALADLLKRSASQ
jgi:hypothetical protein